MAQILNKIKKLIWGDAAALNEPHRYHPETLFSRKELQTAIFSILCDKTTGPNTQKQRVLLPEIVNNVIVEYLLWSNHDARSPWTQTVPVDETIETQLLDSRFRGDGTLYLPATTNGDQIRTLFKTLNIYQPVLPFTDLYGIYCPICHSFSDYDTPCKVLGQRAISTHMVESGRKIQTKYKTQFEQTRILVGCYHPRSKAPQKDDNEVNRYLLMNADDRDKLYLVSGAHEDEIPLKLSLGPRLHHFVGRSRYQLNVARNCQWAVVALSDHEHRACSMRIHGETCLLEMVGPDEHCRKFCSSSTHGWIFSEKGKLYSYLWHDEPAKVILQFPAVPISLILQDGWQHDMTIFALATIQGIAFIHWKVKETRISPQELGSNPNPKTHDRVMTVMGHPRFFVIKKGQ
jgi:hypothetical protein